RGRRRRGRGTAASRECSPRPVGAGAISVGMLVRAVEIHGFRDGAAWDGTELGSLAELPPPPEGTALADALSLLVAVRDAERAPAMLRRLELLGEVAEPRADEHGLLEQVVGLDPGALVALLEDGQRKLVVDATLAL